MTIRGGLEKGFTLVEALVVVTIIGILSSVAMTGYSYYVIQSKSAEVPIMVSNIGSSEVRFFLNPRTTATGQDIPPCFLSAGRTPATITSQSRPWVDLYGGFTVLGVASSSPVYYSYEVSRRPGLLNVANFCTTVTEVPSVLGAGTVNSGVILAIGDLNGDNTTDVLGKMFGGDTAYADCSPPAAPESGQYAVPPGCTMRTMYGAQMQVQNGSTPIIGGLSVVSTLGGIVVIPPITPVDGPPI